MNTLQISRHSPFPTDPPAVDRVALYDQYGSIAYGVIMQIIPQPDVAQQVMVDLFASLDGRSFSPSTSVVCNLIRLARQKALHEKQNALPVGESKEMSMLLADKSPKHIFNLSFYQGYKPELIAEKLQLPYESVLSTIRDYFSMFRSSTTKNRP